MLYLHGTLLPVGEVERPLVVFDPALDLGRGELESLLLGPGDEVPLELRVECPCDLVPGLVGKDGKRRLCRGQDDVRCALRPDTPGQVAQIDLRPSVERSSAENP